jgi:hypothetical protein
MRHEPEARPNVEGTKLINTLAQHERSEVCRAFTEDFESVFPGKDYQQGACTLIGVLDASTAAGDKAQCEKARDVCLAQRTESTAPLLQNQCNQSWQWSGCGVTVHELFSCMKAHLRAIDDLYGDISCDDVANPMSPGRALSPKTPDACKAVRDRCPKFFETSKAPASAARTPRSAYVAGGGRR